MRRDGQWQSRWQRFATRAPVTECSRLELEAVYKTRLDRLLRSHGYSELSALDEWERGRMVRASLPGALVALAYLKIRRA